MRLHYLQHVPFEGPANIETWAARKGWEISATHLYCGERLPSPGGFDWLVVMGGPMNIYEEDLHPWLAEEKDFIRCAVRENKVVVGICLGAQLIADVLGGRVTRNAFKEIGWFTVDLLPESRSDVAFRGLPASFLALHWHGDTFALPPGAVMLARSKACPAQAFSFNGGRVLGLQFHLESSPESARALIENCGDELVPGDYTQSAQAILGEADYFARIQFTMSVMLDNLAAAFREKT